MAVAAEFFDPNERRQLCVDYCEHLANGYSPQSFKVKPARMRDYIQKYGEEFPVHLIEEAEAAGAMFWESRAMDIVQGKENVGKAATALCIFALKARAGWSEQAPEGSAADEPEAKAAVMDVAKRIAFLFAAVQRMAVQPQQPAMGKIIDQGVPPDETD